MNARKRFPYIESIAFDLTIGAGNDGETPDLGALIDRLDREPTVEEAHAFHQAWASCLQQMASP